MNCCKVCKHSVPSPQIERYYCLCSERNKNTPKEERYKRTQGLNCKYHEKIS